MITPIVIARIISIFSFTHIEEPKSVEIYSVGAFIETFFRINCENFSDSFSSSDIKTKALNKGEKLQFLHYLDDLELEKGSFLIDTRSKILIKYSHHTDTLCCDYFHIIYKNRMFKMSKKLQKKIWRKEYIEWGKYYSN